VPSLWECLHADPMLEAMSSRCEIMVGMPFSSVDFQQIEKEWTSVSAMTTVTTGVQQTYSRIAPLRTVLEDPEAPVFDETGHLVLRGVVHPEAVIHGQTCFPRARRNDILLFSGCQQASTLRCTLRMVKHIPWHS